MATNDMVSMYMPLDDEEAKKGVAPTQVEMPEAPTSIMPNGARTYYDENDDSIEPVAPQKAMKPQGAIEKMLGVPPEEVDPYGANRAAIDNSNRLHAFHQRKAENLRAPSAPINPLGGNAPLGDSSQYRNVASLTPTREAPAPVVDADGNSRSTFGSYVRVTSKDGNTVWWENREGQKVDSPSSIRMMDKWNNSSIRYNLKERDRRKLLKNRQNAMVGGQIKSAMADLREKLKLAQSLGKDGALADNDTNDPSIREDPNHPGEFYVNGIVRTSALNDFNKQVAKLGAKDSMERVVVSQRVDRYGNPIGDPQFSALYRKNGIVGKGDGVYATPTLGLADAMNFVKNADIALGKDKSQAEIDAVYSFGSNPHGWKSAEGKAIDPKLIEAQAKMLEQQRLQAESEAERQRKANAFPVETYKALQDTYKMLNDARKVTDFDGNVTMRPIEELSPKQRALYQNVESALNALSKASNPDEQYRAALMAQAAQKLMNESNATKQQAEQPKAQSAQGQTAPTQTTANEQTQTAQTAQTPQMEIAEQAPQTTAPDKAKAQKPASEQTAKRRAPNGNAVISPDGSFAENASGNPLAGHYDSLGKDVLGRLRDVAPSATWNQVAKGMYDNELKYIAENVLKDESAVNVINTIIAEQDRVRSEGLAEKFNREWADAKRSMEAEAVRNRWSQEELNNRLRQEKARVRRKVYDAGTAREPALTGWTSLAGWSSPRWGMM